MKILLVNKFHYMKGGSERYYFTLADAFKEKGHDVVFFAMKDEKNIACEQEKYFVDNSSVNGGIKSKLNMVLHISYSKEAYKKMSLLLQEEKPDLVILNLVHKQITCSIIDAIKDYNDKLPIFWTMHDLIAVCPSYTMLDGNGNICEKCLNKDFNNCRKNKCIKGSTLMSWLSTYEAKQIKKKNWYNKVDLFICPSNFYKNKLEESNFTKSPIVYMPNPLPKDTKFEFKNDVEDYVLFFGRLSKEKGVETLIKSMKLTKEKRKLIILGTGPIEGRLKESVKVEGLEDRVSLLGFKTGTELEKYISKAKVVVLPSEWYENGPYSAMEAMAQGKPLIVSNLGGLPELVDDGVNGYIFNAKDATDLAKKIDTLFDLNNEEYLNLCNESLNKAINTFNCWNYIDKLNNLMEK